MTPTLCLSSIAGMIRVPLVRYLFIYISWAYAWFLYFKNKFESIINFTVHISLISQYNFVLMLVVVREAGVGAAESVEEPSFEAVDQSTMDDRCHSYIRMLLSPTLIIIPLLMSLHMFPQ